MARPRRFPVIFEFCGPEEHDAAFNALAANGLFTKSDLYRMAFDQFLRQQGALPLRMKAPERDRAA
ncbi:hypothetical protein ABIB73_000105 [Bradyrhizobium sp. F1.4.3]|uniref:hypothetical protein n=1 Tax=Bradyrhizobium sp. F1.4.3 TaxID=3156356 RepID=UPI003391EA5E